MSGEHASEKILGKIKILGKMSYLLRKKSLKKMRMNNIFLSTNQITQQKVEK